jgi:hypothetical protein
VNQTNYTVVTTAGATDFICTDTNITSLYAHMTVVLYRGLKGTTNTSKFGTLAPNSSAFVTGTITTSAKALVVVCAANGHGGGAWTAGTVAGSSATLVGVSASSLSSVAYGACEAYLASSSLSGTATMTATGGSGDYAYGVWAFNY